MRVKRVVPLGDGEDVSKPKWLNRTVLGIGLASLFSDVGHEMATSAMPALLASIGASSAVLGLIEGISDGLSSFAKLASGHCCSARGPPESRHRNPMSAPPQEKEHASCRATPTLVFGKLSYVAGMHRIARLGRDHHAHRFGARASTTAAQAPRHDDRGGVSRLTDPAPPRG